MHMLEHAAVFTSTFQPLNGCFVPFAQNLFITYDMIFGLDSLSNPCLGDIGSISKQQARALGLLRLNS
jgi:hypothetical protein